MIELSDKGGAGPELLPIGKGQIAVEILEEVFAMLVAAKALASLGKKLAQPSSVCTIGQKSSSSGSKEFKSLQICGRPTACHLLHTRAVFGNAPRGANEKTLSRTSGMAKAGGAWAEILFSTIG